MSKRLQVIVEDSEYQEIQRSTLSRDVDCGVGAKQALKPARRSEPAGSVGKKLEVIRRYSKCQFPVRDIQDMLAEIAADYSVVRPPHPDPPSGSLKNV